MTNKFGQNTRFHGHWLTIARIAWLLIVSITMALFAYGLLTGQNQLRTICLGATCHPSQLDPGLAEQNRQLGLSLEFYAWYTTLVYAVFGSVNFTIAWLIFLKQSTDWMALYVSLFLVMIGAGANPVIPVLGGVIFVSATAGLFPLFCLFPDGRFVPRWARWLVAGWLLFVSIRLVEAVVAGFSSRGISGGPPSPVYSAAFLVGIAAQVYRYRRVSTPIQRQQSKWAVFGFASWFVSLVALLVAIALFPALREPGLPEFFLDRYAFAFVALLPILFIPAGLAIAILRYRLWDIDIIIRRTLQYTILTGILILMYFAGVVGLHSAVDALTGQESSPIITVLTTLSIAVLINPIRIRVQNFIDRRFYRKRYEAEQALAQFATAARDEVDMNKMAAALLGVVEETLQPDRVSLWLKRPTSKPSLFSEVEEE